jgi:sec-independent protein translocase protein TatB
MLDIGWPELFLILVIALIVIGPRDLPRAMHTVGKWVKRARVMTAEFQRHVDDMVREADMEEVRELKKFTKVNKHTIASEIGKSIDPGGEIAKGTDFKGTFGGKPTDDPTGPSGGAPAAAEAPEGTKAWQGKAGTGAQAKGAATESKAPQPEGGSEPAPESPAGPEPKQAGGAGKSG